MAVVTRKYIHRMDPVAVYGVPEALRDISRERLFYTSVAAFCGPFAG